MPIIKHDKSIIMPKRRQTQHASLIFDLLPLTSLPRLVIVAASVHGCGHAGHLASSRSASLATRIFVPTSHARTFSPLPPFRDLVGSGLMYALGRRFDGAIWDLTWPWA